MVLLRNFLEQKKNLIVKNTQKNVRYLQITFTKIETWSHLYVFSLFFDEIAKYMRFITKHYIFITFF